MLGLPGSRKYPNCPTSHTQNNFQEDEGLCRTIKIIEVHEAQLEFPDGLEVFEKTHFCAVGMDFSGTTQCKIVLITRTVSGLINSLYCHIPYQNAAYTFCYFSLC